MYFEYSQSGLPANQKWEHATRICFRWLTKNMGMFGPERIANFMMNQPVTAAKHLLNDCKDASDESIIIALLGPAKGEMIANATIEAETRRLFGDRTVALLHVLAGDTQPDAGQQRDMTRLFLVEGLSTMRDQLIGRARIDAHHQTRWNILKNFEQEFAKVKGQNPALDKLFEDGLQKSRAALEALDAAPKKAPKRPAM